MAPAPPAYPVRAPTASDPQTSRGRLFPEPPSLTRSAFRRDCDRIIHSAAFRRLAHKTQVFVFHEGDHYRSRLTHTLEVTQVARSIARALGLEEDLAEACALGHDLGHPPFGHAGERALDRCLEAVGGFDHNAQTLRIVTALERRYPAIDGLNLSWETLEGLVKHNGPLTDAAGAALHAPLAPSIAAFNARFDLALDSQPSLEAQAGAIADDIAYNAHDIDDGLRAQLFSIEEVAAAVPLIDALMAEIDGLYGAVEPARRGAELVRRLLTRMIEDVIGASRDRLAEAALCSPDAVRAFSETIIGFSPAMAATDRAIKGFLRPRMYRSGRVMQIMTDAESVVTDLFGRFRAEPAALPPEWQAGLANLDEGESAHHVADFIAGMTDRYALTEHRRLFATSPTLR